MNSMLQSLRGYLRKSIYRRLVVTFVLSTMLLMLVSGYVMVRHETRFLETRSLEQTTNLAQTLAVNSTSWVLASDVVGLQEMVRSISAVERHQYVMVIASDGRVLASNDPNHVGQYLNDEISRRLLDAQPHVQVLLRNSHLIDVAVPVMANKRLIAWARVGDDTEEELLNLDRIRLKNYLFAFGGVMLSLLVAIFIGNSVTRGLRDLMKVAREVQQGRRDMRAVIDNLDEVGQLASSFNRMLDALDTSEKRLEALNRAYAAWTQSSAAIVRERDEQALLESVCQILAERVPFELVWVGLVDAQGWVKVVASSDPDSDYLTHQVRISVDATLPEGQGPMSKAIRERIPQISNDFIHDYSVPWRSAAEENGFFSVAVFPVLREGECVGAITVYSSEHSFFNADIVALLDGLANDLSFALDNFSREEKRRMAEAELQLSASVFEGSSEGIVVTDSDGNIISVNPAFETITGYSEQEVLGRNPRILSSGHHPREFFQEMWRSIADTGSWHGEVWNRRKGGEVYPEWLNINMVKSVDGTRTNYVGLFSDISERKEVEERIKYLAHYDSLTELPNRILFQDRLMQAIIRAQRAHSKVGLVFIDLDRFKSINDTLGHNVGDMLLRTVAQRMLECVREQDTVSRQGGDEFLIVLPDVEYDGAALVAQKLLDVVSRPYVVDEHELNVTPSLGISIFPDDAEDIDTLIRYADVAMYHAKESGRNNYQFYERSMNAMAMEHLTLENNLRRALDRKEFMLYYQPQVDLHTGQVIGCEALIRWNSSELGMVSPGSFIPIAEECGLIGPISEWVLDAACEQVAIWRSLDQPHVPVAVNLSSLQFRQVGLSEKVAQVLARTNLPPHCLELELTEGILMIDAESAIQTIHELGGMGLKLAIDDFGTGYSSLAYLKRFPIHKLKIDQSFVRDIATDPDDASIVRTIIAMAHSLNLKVIAEGVETLEQLTFLRDAGCEEIQGYYFSKPVPAEEFSALLRSGKVLEG